MFKEELLSIIVTWPPEQLNEYIKQLEKRIDDTEQLLRELKTMRRKLARRKTYDNGTRGGK